ncbi:BatA domain-containing protein [Rhodothermus profundi]|uniref:N-terminal double-transmembrane domain-containing protein n=1 Tax=Rhodothermus profundi TaxID=633813 RepID=A0A1M6RE09_9BACT|nr:BatA domain-containing protein [Rhodothermus profundi]SHK30630.1 N-terminal double-transmembrane domain-containing protein [Rhodothermus profundi]
MTFLNPLALLALVAAAIPILVHLFHFRRPQRVAFSSLVFLKELQQTALQRLRIRQWLLLLLRTLALVCLVLAFARPVLRGPLASWVGGGKASVVGLVLDNSPSMAVRDAGGAYFTQARVIAAGILAQLDPDTRVCLVPVAGNAIAPEPVPRSVAEEQLRLLAIQHGARTLSAALRSASACVQQVQAPAVLYVISDLQASMLVDSLEQFVPEPLPTLLIPVGGQTPANLAITAVRIANRIIEQGQPVQIEATLANFGTAAANGVVATLALDEQRVAQASVDLPPGGSARVTFSTTPMRRGWLPGIVELLQPDALLEDNTHYLVLHVPEVRRLLVVAGAQARTDYLELAFAPEIRQDRVRFEITRIDETALPATDLEEYDVVVLVGVHDLSSGEVAVLMRYVAEGGGVLFFPGADGRLADYQQLLTALGAGQIRGFVGNWRGATPIATFGRMDLAHPLFEGLFVRLPGQREVQAERPAVYFALNYAPGQGVEQTLIHMSNGLPLLQEVRHGQGRALLWTVAPDPAWTEWPLRGLFVPLLYRAVFYLAGGEEALQRTLEAGKPARVRLQSFPAAAIPELVGPDGQVYRADPERRGSVRWARFEPGPARPGIYELRAGDQVVQRVAVNFDVAESDLRPESPEVAVRQLQAQTGLSVTLLEIPEASPPVVAEALRKAQVGVALWNVFLGLALGFLVLEMLVGLRARVETVTTGNA